MKLAIRLLCYVFLLLGIVYAGLKPVYNWDMIGYMGSVLEINASSIEEVHRMTFEKLGQELNQATVDRLSSGEYRSAIKNDHRAFAENIPYYAIRIIYVHLIALFFKLGIPLTFATVLPSLLSVFLIVLILHQLMYKETENIVLSSLLAISALYLPQTILLARLSTPDALSALFLLLTVVIYLYQSKWLFLWLLMSVSILTRTDNVVWCVLLIGLEWVYPTDGKRRWVMAIIPVCLLLLCIAINILYNNGGWSILFYNSFIERQAFPLSATPALSLKAYLIVMIKKMPDYLPWFSLIALLFYQLRKVNLLQLLKLRGGKVIAACFGSFLLKFLLFPLFDARFYLVFVFMLLVAGAKERQAFLGIYHLRKS